MGPAPSRQQSDNRYDSIRLSSQENFDSLKTRHAADNDSSIGSSKPISDFVNNIRWTHELEIGTEPEGCLHNYKACTKNPGHTGFLPVKTLATDDLPNEVDKDLMFELIKAHSCLTVRIRSRIVSQYRPQSLLLGGMKPGASITLFGTGFARPKPEPPPSSYGYDIRTIDTYYSISVRTVSHVIFDDVEAGQAEVEFYFDDDEDKSSVVTVTGWKVDYKNTEGDLCCFECSTDNKMLYDRIVRDWDRVQELQKHTKQALEGKRFPYHFIVSHPHGYSKHVSIGNIKEITQADTDQQQPSYFRYNIPTCPGSSGAFIFGIHEFHLTWNEAALASSYYSHCMKNPGHEDFIPIKHFNTRHLPEEFQMKDVTRYVKRLAVLTVHVHASYVSPGRPDGMSFAQMRNMKCVRYGSGLIIQVFQATACCQCQHGLEQTITGSKREDQILSPKGQNESIISSHSYTEVTDKSTLCYKKSNVCDGKTNAHNANNDFSKWENNVHEIDDKQCDEKSNVYNESDVCDENSNVYYGNDTPCDQKSNVYNGNDTPCDQKSNVYNGSDTPCDQKSNVYNGNDTPSDQKSNVYNGNDTPCDQKSNVYNGRDTPCDQKSNVYKGRETPCDQKSNVYYGNDTICDQKSNVYNGSDNICDEKNNVWSIVVMTAAHMVYDDVEAKSTTVTLFFDEERKTDDADKLGRNSQDTSATVTNNISLEAASFRHKKWSNDKRRNKRSAHRKRNTFGKRNSYRSQNEGAICSAGGQFSPYSHREVTLQVSRLLYKSDEEDWCWLQCFTEDEKLARELRTHLRKNERAHKNRCVIERLHDAPTRLSVLISHPHGATKHVTIGEWHERCVSGKMTANLNSTFYRYTTPTCPGSSGGPVLCMGSDSDSLLSDADRGLSDNDEDDSDSDGFHSACEDICQCDGVHCPNACQDSDVYYDARDESSDSGDGGGNCVQTFRQRRLVWCTHLHRLTAYNHSCSFNQSITYWELENTTTRFSRTYPVMKWGV